jgi:hypothetical protein
VTRRRLRSHPSRPTGGQGFLAALFSILRRRRQLQPCDHLAEPIVVWGEVQSRSVPRTMRPFQLRSMRRVFTRNASEDIAENRLGDAQPDRNGDPSGLRVSRQRKPKPVSAREVNRHVDRGSFHYRRLLIACCPISMFETSNETNSQPECNPSEEFFVPRCHASRGRSMLTDSALIPARTHAAKWPTS